MNNINDEFINEKIKPYKVSDFDTQQMYQIQIGLNKELDVSAYADPKFDAYQMFEIRYGLEDGLDITKYADPKFNDNQMREIRFGLKQGLDVTKYADPKFNDCQMFEIRASQIEEIRKELEKSNEKVPNLSEKLDLITEQIQNSSLPNLQKGIAEEIVFNISENIDNNYIKEDKLDINYEKIIRASNNILNIDYLWDDFNQEIQNEVDNMGLEPESEDEEEDER